MVYPEGKQSFESWSINNLLKSKKKKIRSEWQNWNFIVCMPLSMVLQWLRNIWFNNCSQKINGDDTHVHWWNCISGKKFLWNFQRSPWEPVNMDPEREVGDLRSPSTSLNPVPSSIPNSVADDLVWLCTHLQHITQVFYSLPQHSLHPFVSTANYKDTFWEPSRHAGQKSR